MVAMDCVAAACARSSFLSCQPNFIRFTSSCSKRSVFRHAKFSRAKICQCVDRYGSKVICMGRGRVTLTSTLSEWWLSYKTFRTG